LDIFKCTFVCTGHHSDDKIETYLFNTFRGSGIHGLTSLKEKNGSYVRPLINLSKKEIKNYLFENNITCFEDSSNQESTYSRNKLRNIIIPSIQEHINPSVEQSIRRNISVLEEFENTVEKITAHFIEKYVTKKGAFTYISKEVLKDPFYTPLIFKEIALVLIKKVQNREKNIEYIHYEDLLTLFQRCDEKCLKMDLPGEVKVFSDQYCMTIVHAENLNELENISFTFNSIKDIFENDYFSLQLFPAEKKNELLNFTFDFPFYIRSRRDGDKVFYGRGDAQKKAKEILINKKIPQYQKLLYPIIEINKKKLFLAEPDISKFVFEYKGKAFQFRYSPKP
ncbi:MAG: tRNA lysidine(34) synthetase TilS, partial [Nitrospinae bacterium]|nr:tRNA lysidine(34) synthetase TilS [Nitrospinota bacterium]